MIGTLVDMGPASDTLEPAADSRKTMHRCSGRTPWGRRAIRGALWLLLLMFLTATGDSLHLNAAEKAAAPHRYNLVLWHAANALDKWCHLLIRAMPWYTLSFEERRQIVSEYFRLSERLSVVEEELARLTALGDGSPHEMARLTAESGEIEEVLSRTRNDVEEALEATISSIVAEEGLGFRGLLLPPVDFRLTPPPKLLVTSPRERIQRLHDVLLDSGVEIDDREDVERQMLEGSSLSALVTNIGGVATYPASIPPDRDLESTLRIAAHEWLHHYFFFKPLGQNMFTSDEMRVLNETAADIISREIARRARAALSIGPDDPHVGTDPQVADGFDFGAEMRRTRLEVDRLLAAGDIDGADRYMEERREAFQEHGFYIRKLNQAYFAFHGTYAESPTSVSPIGDQLREMHDLVPDLGELIGILSGVSSYREFLERLDEIRSSAVPEISERGLRRPISTRPAVTARS